MDLCFFDLTCNIDICTLINDYKQSELEIIHQQKQYQLLFHWLTVMTSLFKILTFQQHNIVNLHAKSHPMPTEGKETFHNSTSMWINIYPLHVQKQPRKEEKKNKTPNNTYSLNHFFNLRHYSNKYRKASISFRTCFTTEKQCMTVHCDSLSRYRWKLCLYTT